MAMTLDEFCERLGNLRVDRSGGIEKPYKPLLVAAVVILIHKGKQQTRNVLLDGGLRSAFQQLLEALFPRWPHQAKAEYPFRHLENDGVWTLVPIEGASAALRAAKDGKAEAWDVLRHVRCAQLDESVFQRLATSFQDRFRVLRLQAVLPDRDVRKALGLSGRGPPRCAGASGRGGGPHLGKGARGAPRAALG